MRHESANIKSITSTPRILNNSENAASGVNLQHAEKFRHESVSIKSLTSTPRILNNSENAASGAKLEHAEGMRMPISGQ